MKKIIVLLLLGISCNALSANVSFFDIKGKELGIIVDSQNGTFGEYYLFQYENLDFKFFRDGECQITHASDELILKFSDKTISFSITGKSKVAGAIVYSGYGISHRHGDYSINPNPPQNPEFIYQLIDRKVQGVIQPVTSAIKCHSGGEGSTECSVDSSPIAGGGGCTVKCRSGYYSCCDDTRNECKCKKELTKAPKDR